MSTFNDRENAFENKFAHDAETQFKIDARTNKLLGKWAAEVLGKSGDEADAYVLEVIKSGELKAKKIGSSYRVSKQAVDDFLSS